MNTLECLAVCVMLLPLKLEGISFKLDQYPVYFFGTHLVKRLTICSILKHTKFSPQEMLYSMKRYFPTIPLTLQIVPTYFHIPRIFKSVKITMLLQEPLLGKTNPHYKLMSSDKNKQHHLLLQYIKHHPLTIQCLREGLEGSIKLLICQNIYAIMFIPSQLNTKRHAVLIQSQSHLYVAMHPLPPILCLIMHPICCAI